ncbi:MAG: ABC transporter ATP-binding protein [Candidatus Heimdallarchaeota archaeon]|nr:ABC transporter ATP-binding protein [Candidatus Heimdallarchaeota archaeon]MBY8994638.1 ABC transporter ATP-binding protein [Candidatus Heimdallarchaeota archaeon]
MLVTEELVKIFSQGTPLEVHALRGVNLEIEKGEIVAVMGPSGCGKTTLLNMIGGLDKPTSGKVWIGNEEITDYPDHEITTFRKQNLSFIFQFFNLFDVLTAVENVALPLLLMGEPTKAAEEKSKSILREVGMGSRLYNRPNEMSGGQRQRVAIARSLITNPKIILADEPTGDLSSVISRDIMKLFRRLNEDLGQTFVLVTHSELIGSLCDRIIKMNDGLIIS